MRRLARPRASLLALARRRLAAAGGSSRAGGPRQPRRAALPASLIADQVTYDRDTDSSCRVRQCRGALPGRVLRATRIIYDERADEIRAEGPLLLTDPDGGVLIADSAALTPDLKDGLITSARLLIDGTAPARRGRGRAAVTGAMRRSSARSRAPARSAPSNPTPTWAIRAVAGHRGRGRAPHLLRERPPRALRRCRLAIVPRAQHPRAGRRPARAASCAPQFQQSDIYGFGFKLPYYTRARAVGRRDDHALPHHRAAAC